MMCLNVKAETTGENILKINNSLGTANSFTFISLLLGESSASKRDWVKQFILSFGPQAWHCIKFALVLVRVTPRVKIYLHSLRLFRKYLVQKAMGEAKQITLTSVKKEKGNGSIFVLLGLSYFAPLEGLYLRRGEWPGFFVLTLPKPHNFEKEISSRFFSWSWIQSKHKEQTEVYNIYLVIELKIIL